MSTRTLGMPADLRRRLEYILPRQRGTYPPFVRVTPRDADERRCAAWASDHYEVHAFYTTSDTGSLAALEAAFQDVPGVYLTTQVDSSGGRTVFNNPAWPAPLGSDRRDRDSLRIQVIALIRDEGPTR